MGCECLDRVHVHVSGGLAYMSWDVNVQKSTCIWWLTCHGM